MSLTPLERDLLACVERLVTTCETSAKELSSLQQRSTNMIETRIAGLADCVSLLIRSQNSSTKALLGLVAEEASYNLLDKHLQESLRLARSAEKKLKQS